MARSRNVGRSVIVAESPSIAVHRALGMLEAISKSGAGLSNSELSRKLKVPKSSTSYILRALEDGGYVRREADGKYRLGLALLSLSSRAMESLDVRQVALPILQHLVERSGLTAHLAVLDHGQAVYIAKADAPGFIKMNTWPGRRMCSRSACSLAGVVMVCAVHFFIPFPRMRCTSSSGRCASSAFPTDVECRFIRRPGHVFILMKPGASALAM